MVAKLNAKIPERLDLAMRLVMERWDLAMRWRFKENEILRRSTPTVSPFMANMEQYTVLYVYTDIIQNQLVRDAKAPLPWVVPVKSRYGDTTCVTYE